MSGNCTRVAFVSDATNLVRGAAAAGHRLKEIYLHLLGGPTGGGRGGATMLVSATHAGRPANADADQVSLSRDGRVVAFSSSATNLGLATNGVSQVWSTTVGGNLARSPTLKTTLLSQTPDGVAGDAPSSRPSVDHDGGAIAFETLAPDLVAQPNAGVSQIIRAEMTTPRPTLEQLTNSERVTRLGRSGPPGGNAESHDPSITDGGEWVMFDSRASNLVVPGNQIWTSQREVYRWTTPALKTYADRTGVVPKTISRTPAENPATSARGKYITIETEDPLLFGLPSPPIAHQPTWFRQAVRLFRSQLAAYQPGIPNTMLANLPGADGYPEPTIDTRLGDPRLHQVWVVYVGPE